MIKTIASILKCAELFAHEMTADVTVNGKNTIYFGRAEAFMVGLCFLYMDYLNSKDL